jgi:hypothetical protein
MRSWTVRAYRATNETLGGANSGACGRRNHFTKSKSLTCTRMHHGLQDGSQAIPASWTTVADVHIRRIPEIPEATFGLSIANRRSEWFRDASMPKHHIRLRLSKRYQDTKPIIMLSGSDSSSTGSVGVASGDSMESTALLILSRSNNKIPNYYQGRVPF